MVNPTTGWDKVPVYGFYFATDDTTPLAGTVRLTLTQRITRSDGRRIYPEGSVITRIIGDLTADTTVREAVRVAWRAADAAAAGGAFDGTAWDARWAVLITGGVFASFPASDDPDVIGNYQVKVEEILASGKGGTYYVQPLLAHLALTPPGVNLGLVNVGMAAAQSSPIYARGIAGGVAALDAAGNVLDGSGAIVGTGVIANGSITKAKLATAVQTSLTAADNALPAAQVGAPNGAASLDLNGLVPVAQLPAGVGGDPTVNGVNVFIDQTTGLPYIAV